MNILLLTNELRYTCGVTNHLLHLSKVLADSGKVKLWIICGGGNGMGRFKNIDVKIIHDKRFLHKGRNLTGYFSAITFLAKFIRKHRIDIIHSHTHYAANIAATAARISKVRTVQTNHGILQNKGRLKHFNADKYIAINEHIKEYLINNKISTEENIYFIHCGIPVYSKPPIKPSGKLKITAASRFIYEKGLDLFIKAAAGLDEDAKLKAEFVLAGEGELENSLKELAGNSGNLIKFTGAVKDTYALLRDSHIFVYASRSSSEGFPSVITEAGACNCLLLSSRFNGSANVITEKDAILFEPDNVNELTEQLANAINNYKNLKPLSLSFYNKVKDWFNLETMRDKHISLYEQAVNGR